MFDCVLVRARYSNMTLSIRTNVKGGTPDLYKHASPHDFAC